MNNQNPSKVVKNTLLQNADMGIPLFSPILSNPLIAPVPKEEPTFAENAEIDSFIGQEKIPQPTVPSNSIVNENLHRNTEQSVPLVVPLSAETSTSRTAGIQNLFGDCGSSRFEAQVNENFAPLGGPPSVSLPSFFNPTQSTPSEQSTVFPTLLTSVEYSGAKIGAPPPASVGAGNTYRLGSLKRPAYVPVPGLSSAANVSQNCVPFPSPSQSSNVSSTFFTPDPTEMTSSFGNPSSTGPYSSTTVPSTSSRSAKPSMVSEKPSLYRPVYHHWFYRKDVEKNSFYSKEPGLKSIWKPFGMTDSLALESACSLPSLNENTLVPTDGGRYDVNVVKREKRAVYWKENPSIVRRCSWFSKGPTDSYFVPYEEDIAEKLEKEFKAGMETGEWNRKIEIGNEEVILHNSALITHQIKCVNVTLEMAADSSITYRPMRRRSRVKRWIRNSYDAQWATITNQPSPLKPRIVKRGGFDDFDIDDGEPEKIDHLMFLVHGIGQFCDLKFRSIVEVVDEFRTISLQLTQSHFQESCELGEVNRIEILPVSWHKALHGDETGVDKRVQNITLPSIPRMRDFANDTILDILFYTSPVFCQVIIDAVAGEINRLYTLFRQRNPYFNGKISVGGHSLGSLILFDLLSNQPASIAEENSDDVDDFTRNFENTLKTTVNRRLSVITVGKAGTGQPLVKYPRLSFEPRFFFAFGSPIACFVATRSNEILGEDFKFPTCKGFFNIFHPYDPIAYRVEPLIIPSLSCVKPVQISHHKGRKRMHLELKDTVSHVGQRLIDTMKNTWNMVYHLAVNKSVDAAESVIQQELNQVLQTSEVLAKRPINPNLIPTEPVNETTNLKVGRLNEGKRVDYVLQEAPVEYFNEYLFALASHLCYWTSRDTMLLVLKEVYGDMGVFTDNQLPQTILPFDITDGTASSNASPSTSQQVNLEPPPTYGFARK